MTSSRKSPLIPVLLMLLVCHDEVLSVKARFFFRERLQIPLFGAGRRGHRAKSSLVVDHHHHHSPRYDLHGGHQEEENTNESHEQHRHAQERSVPQDDKSSSSLVGSSAPEGEEQTSKQQQQQQQQRERPPTRPLFGTRPINRRRQQEIISAVKNRFQNRLDQIRASANALLPGKNGGGGGDAGAGGGEETKKRFLSALGPSVLAFWTNRGGSSSTLISFGKVYALSLLGSSVGFYSFLYFISVGYALGITVPLVAALHAYQQQQQQQLQQHQPTRRFVATAFAGASAASRATGPHILNGPSTYLHSVLVILWGIRAFTFFLWREYVNWPALHKQIRYVNESNAPSLAVKCLIWIMYSFLYTAMSSPCWFRLQQSARILKSVSTSSSSTSSFIATTKSLNVVETLCAYVPILLQVIGLLLETVADYQKSTFKFTNRYEWCNVGLWKWSAHPNYLGEMIFWTGTYLGWIVFGLVLYFTSTSPRTLPFTSLLSLLGQFAFCTLGYVFIITVLRGSIASMSQKHWQKYGHLPEYAEFRQSHGLMGPKRRRFDHHSSNSTATDEEQQQGSSKLTQ